MLRQAVQTLTGRGETEDARPVEDTIYELGDYSPESQTEPVQDGSQDQHRGDEELRATVDRLSTNFDTLSQRLSDKDRYIGQLEGEMRQIREGVPQPSAGSEPQPDRDPVLDQATAALIAEKYPEDPVAAIAAVAEHIDNRVTRRADEKVNQQAMVQEYTAKLQGIERSILRQVDLIYQNYGQAANGLVGDFVQLAQSGQATPHQYQQTWLGYQIHADQALALTNQGVYRLIESELLRRGIQQDTVPQPEPAQPRQEWQGVSRPSAPARHVEVPSDGTDNEISMEDKIGDAIVNANDGDDSGLAALFRG